MEPSLHALAARQLADYRDGRPGTWFAEPSRSTLSLEAAYAVQDAVRSLRTPSEPVVGYKVGCTGPGTRAQFGLDGPIRGTLYATECHDSGDKLSAASYTNLAIEGELAVRLDHDARIELVFPVIELHNYVFRGHPPTLAELVANNGLNAGVVLPVGPAQPWRGGRTLTGLLRVEISGTVVDEGPMAGVPGGPAGSVEWLRNQLAASGQALQPGQVVLTGTPLGLFPVAPGDHVRVVAERLGSLEVSVGG